MYIHPQIIINRLATFELTIQLIQPQNGFDFAYENNTLLCFDSFNTLTKVHCEVMCIVYLMAPI